jgi:predicted ester cyclase
MGTLEENKAIARRFIQIWGKGDLGIIDELASPEITMKYPATPQVVKGIPALKEYFTGRVAKFYGDRDLQVEDVIAGGDKVVVRWNFSCTHQGEWPPGAPATGKRLSWTGITIYRIAGGKVVEERGEEDIYGAAFRQLDLIAKPRAQ